MRNLPMVVLRISWFQFIVISIFFYSNACRKNYSFERLISYVWDLIMRMYTEWSVRLVIVSVLCVSLGNEKWKCFGGITSIISIFIIFSLLLFFITLAFLLFLVAFAFNIFFLFFLFLLFLSFLILLLTLFFIFWVQFLDWLVSF